MGATCSSRGPARTHGCLATLTPLWALTVNCPSMPVQSHCPRHGGNLQYISGCAGEQQTHSAEILTAVSLRKSGSRFCVRWQIEELAISSCVSWQQRYKAEAVSGCFVSPLLCTCFALLNCFVWDTCLGQAAGVSYYIHPLTNEYDIRVTSVFYKYLLPIWFTRQHRPGVKTEGDWILRLLFKAGGISPLYRKNFSLTCFTSIYHCKP